MGRLMQTVNLCLDVHIYRRLVFLPFLISHIYEHPNGEFMFGCSYIWEIKNGKKTNLLREATLSGIAFDVLQTVDMVSEEFQWDLGSGYCGKGQPAKVDAGGPYIRCMINVGGNA